MVPHTTVSVISRLRQEDGNGFKDSLVSTNSA